MKTKKTIFHLEFIQWISSSNLLLLLDFYFISSLTSLLSATCELISSKSALSSVFVLSWSRNIFAKIRIIIRSTSLFLWNRWDSLKRLFSLAHKITLPLARSISFLLKRSWNEGNSKYISNNTFRSIS